jgi:hypothetical protein
MRCRAHKRWTSAPAGTRGASSRRCCEGGVNPPTLRCRPRAAASQAALGVAPAARPAPAATVALTSYVRESPPASTTLSTRHQQARDTAKIALVSGGAQALGVAEGDSPEFSPRAGRVPA